ncbi:HEPN domain-containing protein [Galbibacter mesophilus]|uniref:HEPN domain-containing protein n=1 Tax=Galbibacter mesophilus TaxID=379069 RepID=UPI00191FB595|nr:HEPN domain-containing protein [Galbibacter mesophilus]MCM5661819.1 HEPN domain-containing protein [Galbibacter mesophilus]
MKNLKNTQERHVIGRLTSLLDIGYIYKSRSEENDSFKPLLIVILNGNCSSLTHELYSMVAKIFQEETDFLYRIFPFEYARQQLAKENLFFIYGCSPANLIYKSPNVENPLIDRAIDVNTFNRIEGVFERERKKINAFLEAANFFIDKENFSQAAFMLHQYIELWFRYAGLFIMGKERKSHSIKELQNYLKAFSPLLGNLFDSEIEEEQNLLKLLDEAYIATRYHNNYHINKGQIQRVLEKANEAYTHVGTVFKLKMQACSDEFSENKNSKSESDSKNSVECLANYQEIREKIQDLTKRKLYEIKPRSKKFYYKANFKVGGLADVLYDIAGIMKVCIIALEHADNSYGRLIRQPHFNIQTALEHILQLLPFEEVECLEEIIEEYIMPYENKEKETIENPARA